MLLLLSSVIQEQAINSLMAELSAQGARGHLVKGEVPVIVVTGGHCQESALCAMPGVEKILQVNRPYPLGSREFQPLDTTFEVSGVEIGGNEVVIMAGPCSVEDRNRTLEIAQAVKEAGAQILRGGAYKPRSSPYAFQGMGEAGLEILAEVRQVTGLPVVTEVMAPEQVPLVAQYADILQIGARNMQNFPLLNAAGRSHCPVLLKRGLSATIEELLMAAEYILSNGNKRVILCERGIRTFETATRNTTDINAIPVLKSLSHLPVLLDPSHSTGSQKYVSAVAKAGIAAGADGLIVEVHNAPEKAFSDGGQSLTPERFAELVCQVRYITQAVGRRLSAPQKPEYFVLPQEMSLQCY